MIKIAVVLEPCEEGGFSAHVPTLPGCFSEGETVEEVLSNIREAIELHLEAIKEDQVVEEGSLVRELVWTEAHMIHPIYMPYTREQLLPHFRSGSFVDEFIVSSNHYQAFLALHGQQLREMPITTTVRQARQIERDERFWVTSTLKTLFDRELMAPALARAFNGRHPLGEATWKELVGEKKDQTLQFQFSIPSPRSYCQALGDRYADQGNAAHLIPYVVDAAYNRYDLEGPTEVDVVFRNDKTGFYVMFEAKVLSDISCEVRFDTRRNQFARNIDVMLEQAVPHRYFCLLTPDLFRNDRSSRYYGLLYDSYNARPELLAQHLPHRLDLNAVEVIQRIGWLTFEDCKATCQDVCQWLNLP